jgi:hypothetical protein
VELIAGAAGNIEKHKSVAASALIMAQDNAEMNISGY